MPLLKRKPFTPDKPPADLKPSEEVFVCRHTNEVFTDYESFFKRTILCNSLVWSCKFSGKSNLTYHEALESEQEIIKQAESLSSPLQRAALTLVHHIQRGRLANLCDEVFSYLKDRYQEGEDVEVQHLGKRKKGKIQKVIEPDELQNGIDNPLGSPKSRKSSSSSIKDKKAEKSTGTPAKIRKSSISDKESPVKSRKGSDSTCKSPGKSKSVPESTPNKSRRHSSKESVTSPKMSQKQNDKEMSTSKSKKSQKSGSEKLKSPKSKSVSNLESDNVVIIVEDDDEIIGKHKEKKVESPLKSPKGNQTGFWPDPKNYKYAVQLYPEKKSKTKEDKKACKEVIIVEFNHISRKKGTFTRDKLKNFLKLCCVRSTSHTDDGFYYVKVEYRKKFDLGEPLFEIPLQLSSPPKGKSRKRKKSVPEDDAGSSSVKKKKLEGEEETEKSKKHKSKEDIKGKKKTDEPQVKKLTPEEKLKIIEEERQKRRMMIEEDKEKRRIQREQERLEQKTKREEERAQKKIERDQEREKLREQKRLEAVLLKEWSKPREDLELDDLKDLPQPVPVKVRISNELFGDAVMVLEFLNVFGSLFDMKDEFPSGLHFTMLEEALAEHDAEGVFYDLLQFLLGAILRTHMEEEEDEGLESADAKTPIELDDEDYHGAKVSASAAMAAVWPILHQGKPLHELIMDPFTCTELLRLHLLSSGARVGCGDPEYRWQSRGGFTYSDDAGVEFRHHEPHIMKTLMTGTVYDLSAEEKIKILTALCGQLMTYATSREYIEDGFDRLKKARREWLSDQWAEQRREKEEAAARYRKRQEERLKLKEELEKKKKDKENEKNQDGKPVPMETSSQDETKPTEEPDPVKQETKKAKNKKKTGKETEKEKENESENKPATEETEKPVEEKNKQDDVVQSKQEEEQIALQKKIDRERKEQEYLSEVRKAVAMSSVQPLGRDRIYRRYWMFKSLNGLFIEDDDPDLPTFLETIFEEENCEEEEKEESTSEGKTDENKVQNTDKVGQDENKIKGPIPEKERGAQHSEKFAGLKTVLKRDFDKMVKDGVMSGSFNMVKKANKAEIIAKYGHREGVTRWSYIAEVDDLECLVSALNPRGQRERLLREALQLDLKHLSKVIEKCPFKEENVVPKKNPKMKPRKQQALDKSQFHSTEDFVEANLRDQILDLEDRLWQGGLGVIKVEDRGVWRAKVENGIYSHIEKTVEAESKEKGVKQESDVNGVKENEDRIETNGDVPMKEEDKEEPLVNGQSHKLREEAEETKIKEEKPRVKKETTKKAKIAVLTNGNLEGSDTEQELIKVEESKRSVLPADAKQSEKSVFKAIPTRLKLDFSSNRTSLSPPQSRTGTPVISLAPNFEHINPAVKELALALLKVEQGIESKYLSPPLGEDEETKRQKQKDAAASALAEFNEMTKAAAEGKERKKKTKLDQNEKGPTEVKSSENDDAEDNETKEDEEDDRSSNSSKAKDPPKQKTCLERWEESLMACTSLSQVFVHLNTLDGSITWSKSVLNARCRLCRRKGDAEKMLLCDACDRGHHMYCLKPPIKEIPEGNWFCPDCRPKETRRSERRRRAPVAHEEEEEEEHEDDEDESESEEESEEGSDTEEESEEDDVSDADSEHVDMCAQCELGGELLCCDVCPLAYHVDCAYPPLRRIPRGNWACQVCTGADDERPKKCRVKKSIIKAALYNAKEIEKQKVKSSKAKKPKSTKRSLSPVTTKPHGRRESIEGAPRSSKRQKVQDTSSIRSKRNIPASLRIKGRLSVDSSRSPSPVGKSATRRDPRVTGRLIKCGKLLEEVIGNSDADFFTETISLSKFPNYNRKPTDLETIKTNLKENAYDSVEDFISDVRKVFIDCAEHFRPRAKEARAGVRLSAFFETRLSEMGLDTSERSVRSCRKT